MLTGAELRITLLDGANRSLRLPHRFDDDVAALDQLKRIGSIVGDEFRVRRTYQASARASGRNVKPNAWLKTICYRVIVEYIHQEHLAAFDSNSAAHGRYDKRQFSDLNVFQKGLMAIFAHDRSLLGPRDRHRFGAEMAAAYYYHVPAEFLNGFIHEYLSRAPAVDFDADLESWVIYQSTSETLSGLGTVHRGKYPKAITKEIRKAVKKFGKEQEVGQGVIKIHRRGFKRLVEALMQDENLAKHLELFSNRASRSL